MSSPPADARAVVDAFTDVWWQLGDAGATWKTTSWMGTPIQKHPMDLLILQEIVWETRPQLIVETGTCRGGSALFLAHLLDLMGDGRVLTADIAPLPDRPAHPRITYSSLSSASRAFADEVAHHAATATRVMVDLDSDHSFDHVRAELELLAPFVTVGCYLVVEDGCVNGHPLAPEFGPGPYEATHEFLAGRDDFVVDHHRERLLTTFNPGGFLRRVR